MTLDTLIMLLGVFVAAFPFLQLPPSWTTIPLFLAGAVIIGCGIVVRRRGTARTSAQVSAPERDPHFVDAVPQREGNSDASMQR